MAFTTTTNLPLKLPVPGSREPAQIALINENMVAVDAHDHTTGKAVAVGRLRSGLQANRPAAGQAGNVYFATDTGKFYVDSGAAWVEFLTTGGTSTITGWTLVDPIIRDTLQFGPEPTGTPDATLSRTGAGALRVDNFLGVGVNPASDWAATFRAVQIGQAGTLNAATDHTGTNLASNMHFDGATNRALVTGPGAQVQLYNGELNVYTAASVAAGEQQAATLRLKIDQAGNLGVGVTPAAWGGYGGLQVGTAGAVWANLGAGSQVWLSSNTYFDGATQRALRADGASQVHLNLGAVEFQTAPSAAAGAAQTFTTRAQIANTGTLTLTPDAGSVALIANGSLQCSPWVNTGSAASLYTVGHMSVYPGGGSFIPHLDNTWPTGGSGNRWTAVYAAAGAINTSSREAKEGLTPLDPAACYRAAKDVRWYDFRYAPPVYTEPEPPPDIAYDAADDNETKAEKKAKRDEAEAQAKAAYLKMVAETAPARHQRGFVFPTGAESKDEAGGTLPPVPDLFGLSDRESTTPQADLATLGAAMQEIIRRLELLEAASGQAPAA